MVHLDYFSKSIYSVLANFEQAINLDDDPSSLSALLSLHFLGNRKSKFPNLINLIGLETWFRENGNELDQAPVLAVLGCLVSEQMRAGTEVEIKNAVKQFDLGIERLRQRQAIFTTSNSWILNSEVVLGISLGVFRVNSDFKQKEWLKGVLTEGVKRGELPRFLKLVYSYCLLVSGETSVLSLSSEINYLLELKHDSTIELTFEVLIVKQDTDYVLVGKNEQWLESALAKILEECISYEIQNVSSWKAAILKNTLSGYVFNRSKLPRLEFIIDILSNFDPAMERWNPKWKIENEYDIQSVLWLILRSVFSDLRYEESFPKLGRSGHRYDIGIPQLSLVVELKYTRSVKDFQKILDEVSKDAVQITTQTSFKEILVFVYDNSCSVEQHEWTKDAMERIDRVKACIIKSAPSNARVEKKKRVTSKKKQ